MDEKIIKLRNKLFEIKKQGNLKIYSTGFVNIGVEIEKLLGLETNSFPVADIDGIELKVSKRNSNHPITLFNCTCDGPDFFELNRLVNTYGARDTNFTNTKLLFINLSANKYTHWGKNLKMKLYIERKVKKIYIIVAHKNGKIIEKRSYWDFYTLEKIFEQKLKYLCMCSYVIFYVHNERYYRLIDYKFMKYKKFDSFLDLLENGDINVNIKYGVYKHGKKLGLSYNHGTAFTIKKNTLSALFEYFL